MRLIGIDCATQAGSVGLATAHPEDGGLVLERVELGEKDLATQVSELIDPRERCLIAMDAPLGWPTLLGTSLGNHLAGQPLATPAHDLFRRRTDVFIKAQLGKQPLDVGADRIARTAHAALGLLEAVRRSTGEPIPLAWGPEFPERVAAIEVYPAGTLRARGVRDGGYKRSEQKDEREEIISALALELHLCDQDLMRANADALDAAVCVLAAQDFLDGATMGPVDIDSARREGWIWCLDPIHRRVGHSA